MIEDLSNELSRVISVYKNRADLFKWNGKKTSFSIKDIVRHHLFAKAESNGFTPIPNVRMLQWEIDLVCLRGLKPAYVFIIRENKKTDYRQLLLFPKDIQKVLVCLTKSAVPKITDEIEIVRVTRRPTEIINRGVTIKRITDDYRDSFRKVYGFEPTYSSSQLVGGASKLSMFWIGNAKDLNFKEYCMWFMKRKLNQDTDDDMERMTNLHELMNKSILAAFRLSKRETSYDDSWTKEGW